MNLQSTTSSLLSSTLPGGKYLIYLEYLDLYTCLSYSGHCKSLAPEYAKAAQRLAKNDPPYSLAKVDATEQKKVADRFGVKGFPTLYFFK